MAKQKIRDIEMWNQRACKQLQTYDWSTVSPTESALILSSIQAVPACAAVAELLSQRLRKLATKHWILDAELEEVFCVLNALAHYNSKLLHGSVLAYALERLLAAEVTVGGPYAAHDGRIEPLANIYIADFLRSQEVTLPELQKFIVSCLAQHDPTGTTSSLGRLYYALAQVIAPTQRTKLVRMVNRLPCNSPLDAALVACSLLRLGDTAAHTAAVVKLHDQLRTFDWHAQTIGETALLIEALMSLQVAAGETPDTAVVADKHQKIVSTVRAQLATLPLPVRRTGQAVFEQLVRADKNYEIALMADYFADSLIPKGPSEAVRVQYGVANYYSWLATIIYDDFIDDEGQPAHLPFANIAQRRSLLAYREIAHNNPKLQLYVEQTYDWVDHANAWEVDHARAALDGDTITIGVLPRYGRRIVLAERAFGHALGPMLITMMLPAVTVHQVDAMQRALQQYLIARQLNDDLHDWRKDLQAGQLSSVVSDMLRGAFIPIGTHKLSTLTPRLENYFLQAGLKKICVQILKHLQQCHQAIDESRLLKTDGGFIWLVDDLQASVQQALRIQASERAFLYAVEDVMKPKRSRT